MREVINLAVSDDDVAPLTPEQIEAVIRGETVCYSRGYLDDIRVYFRNYDVIYEFVLPKESTINHAHAIGKVEKYYED